MYWNLSRDLEINKPIKLKKPALVYHRTITENLTSHLIKDIELIGQDFLDEVVFTNNLEDDTSLKISELAKYNAQGNKEEILSLIKKKMVFFNILFNNGLITYLQKIL
ncbi:MAG: hypothetical protein H6690_00085 [Erysipelotrichaceae bacterium]|nr:hypothetical protein [Erysipelotrichaceae bacterium]